MATLKEDGASVTLTRSQLLSERGYSPEVINGTADHNGNGVEAVPVVRVCPECGGPVPEDRKVTCSSTCAQRRDHHKGRTRPKSSPVVEVSTVPNGSSPGFVAAMAVLVGEQLGDLGAVRRVTIELAAHTVTISRSPD